jgi:hypothetical protein
MVSATLTPPNPPPYGGNYVPPYYISLSYDGKPSPDNTRTPAKLERVGVLANDYFLIYLYSV